MPKYKKCWSCGVKINIEKESHFKIGAKYICFHDDSGECTEAILHHFFVFKRDDIEISSTAKE